MNLLRLIATVLLMLASPLYAEPSPASANAQPADITMIEAGVDPHQRMTVPVVVAGSGPYRFLVDTGSEATVITGRVADALGLVSSGQATLVAMASRTRVDTVALDRLAFARREFSGLTAPLLRDRDIGADGILGLDALQELRVVLDFAQDTIAVVDGETASDAGYEIVVRGRRRHGQMIITDAHIGGVKTAIIIDTGAWHSIGNRALQRRLRTRITDGFRATDVTGTVLNSDGAVVSDVRIGRIGLNDIAMGFTDSPAFAALGLARRPALILGMGNLRPFQRVAIDFSERKILFDVPADAVAKDFGVLFR